MMKQHEIAWRSPLAAFAPLAALKGAEVFHNADWRFVVAHPAEIIEGFSEVRGDEISPFDAMAALHARRRLDVDVECGAPFASGIAGYVGYECGRLLEPSAAGPDSPFTLPDYSLAAYDAVAAFDVRRRRAFLLGRSRNAIEQLETSLGDEGSAPAACPIAAAERSSNFTRDEHCAAVAAVVERIRDGELFQANVSRRLSIEARDDVDAFDLFRRLADGGGAPFASFLQQGDSQIVSMSPERFFAVERRDDGRFRIVAEPIKGTRPRGATAEEDARLLEELVADLKDRAENVMIADLTRNDLSRICDDHSVSEDAICEAASFPTVHHLVSRISGTLRRGLTAVDALAGLFPCGSVTGAPKVQAMKTIAEIERTGRGPYCGAIGWIDDRGGADFSVAIRLAIVKGRRIVAPVGGGVTLKSNPQAEYEETVAKAQWLLRAIGGGAL